jgi:hypothetical protein
VLAECIDHGKQGFGGGYATAWLHGSSTTLHRKVYYEATGELPDVVRHTCDNRRCIQPAHLIGGTQVDNMDDMQERGRAGDCRNFSTSNGRAVLSDADVALVRGLYVKGSREFGLPALARRFRVGTSQLWRIISGSQRQTSNPQTC